jgi:hypothetical protein
MLFKDTPENRSLVAVVERNANSATGLNLAHRACWYGGAGGLCLLGLGALLAGAGIGAQKAQEGYASIIGNQEIAERAAQTTAAMLRTERDEFHAMLANERGELLAKIAATKLQGTVTGEVSLRPATVGLNPNSTVRAVGDDAPRPKPAQIIQADVRPASGAPVKTDVVQFNTVSYAKGVVETGWQYTDADAKAPAKQWCLYIETGLDGTGHDVELGVNGHKAGLPTPSPFPSVDLLGAFASCVWWDSRTPASAKAPAKPDNQAAPSSPRVISARVKG